MLGEAQTTELSKFCLPGRLVGVILRRKGLLMSCAGASASRDLSAFELPNMLRLMLPRVDLRSMLSVLEVILREGHGEREELKETAAIM